MKAIAVIEKVKFCGNVVDLNLIPPETIELAANRDDLTPGDRFKWVQVIGGKVVQGFTENELLIIGGE